MLRGREKGVLHIDVITLMKKIELILKILVTTQITSRYRSVFKGKGLEFEDFRVYSQGDDAKEIDWKTSVRTNDLLIKQYKEERELNVFFLVDVSSSMIFGSTEKIKMEYAAEIAAALAYLVNAVGDKPGLVMHSDVVAKMIPPGRGKNHFFILLRSLVDTSLYGGGYNLTKPVDFILKTTHGRGLMIIISDFIGMEKDWDKTIRRASLNFDVVGIMVRDPRDQTLPIDAQGQVVVGDPFSEKSLLVDTRTLGPLYEKYVKMQEQYIKKVFQGSNADFISMRTSDPYVKPLIEFFMKRGGRI